MVCVGGHSARAWYGASSAANAIILSEAIWYCAGWAHEGNNTYVNTLHYICIQFLYWHDDRTRRIANDKEINGCDITANSILVVMVLMRWKQNMTLSPRDTRSVVMGRRLGSVRPPTKTDDTRSLTWRTLNMNRKWESAAKGRRHCDGCRGA